MGIHDHLHRAFRGANGSLDFAITDSGDVTLTAVKSASHRIYIESIDVTIETDAQESITFLDTAGTPVIVEKTESSPGPYAKYAWKFPGGKPLTLGEDFIMRFSGQGLAGHVQWIGHQRRR